MKTVAGTVQRRQHRVLGRALLLGAFCCLSGVAAAQMQVDLSAEASVLAINDMAKATVFVEATAESPSAVAKLLNPQLTEALKLSKAKTGVRVKSGRQSTVPMYNKTQKIEAWRMRAEIELESEDLAGLSELLKTLQMKDLSIGRIQQMPTAATQVKVEEEATRLAIVAFQKRAAAVAAVFGKPYRIKQMNINQQGGGGVFFARANRLMAGTDGHEGNAVPLEAGETRITTQINGQIEIAN